MRPLVSAAPATCLYLRGRGYLGPPPWLGFLGCFLLFRPRPCFKPRPFDCRSGAPCDVAAALIQRTLRPTRVSRQPARVGAGPAPSTGAKPSELPRRGAGCSCSFCAVRHVPSHCADPRPPVSRPSAAHRPSARPGMRTPPAPGSQVSGGRRALARGAPETRTWLGPQPLGQGSSRSAGSSSCPGSVRPLGLGRGGRVTCTRARLARPRRRNRCPLWALCLHPGSRVGRTSSWERKEVTASLLGVVSKSYFGGMWLPAKGTRLSGHLLRDPLVSPPLPARLLLRAGCCRSSALAPAESRSGLGASEVFPQFLEAAPSLLPGPPHLSEGLCGARGRASPIRGLGAGPCPFPAEMLRRP